jgi:phosphoenolpyruvate synthase/pyruvate phosphate dikinase
VPEGFAVPFALYHRFMEANGFYGRVQSLLADPAFRADPAVREARLGELRRAIRQAPVPADVSAKLAELQARFPQGTALRCRSSTNNEDLPGFNGAGLYDSYTHRPNEGALEGTVKQVWASLWNYRAFEERDFYRIDHLQAAMGVLVHPNFDDERSNGVAITRNPFDPAWPGFYVNAQVGESLITNPDGARPEEFLVARLGPQGEYEVQYVTRSDQVPAGQTVLSRPEVLTLARALDRIQRHFKQVYQAQQDPKFAMDVEWKFDPQGRLVIKQARPVVD